MYSEQAAYYSNFCAGYWAAENAAQCPCHGNGWALSEVDTWHKCPVHFKGQPHPEDDHAFDDPIEVNEVDTVSFRAPQEADTDGIPF